MSIVSIGTQRSSFTNCSSSNPNISLNSSTVGVTHPFFGSDTASSTFRLVTVYSSGSVTILMVLANFSRCENNGVDSVRVSYSPPSPAGWEPYCDSSLANNGLICPNRLPTTFSPKPTADNAVASGLVADLAGTSSKRRREPYSGP
uniref:Uncharacterized protein n=1 Tax=Cryptococcus bacillisporus CA1280 TaxID=1296109 RepID=A0A0D0VC45_CRYGA|nr:hypothetical protein I312_05672 [Cryptococcus bacillisporus CA1280]